MATGSARATSGRVLAPFPTTDNTSALILKSFQFWKRSKSGAQSLLSNRCRVWLLGRLRRRFGGRIRCRSRHLREVWRFPGARIDPTGAKTFVLRYRPKGYGASGPKRFITIGRFGVLTVDEARNRAREILGAVATGGDPAADIAHKRAASTFAELSELFLKEHVETKRKSNTAES